MPKTRNVWTAEMEDALRKLYPSSSWDEILNALPGVTKTGVHQRAVKLGIKRWHQGRVPVGRVASGDASDVEIGWLAGFIDGESSITLRYIGRKDGRFYLSPGIQVVNNDKGASDKVLELMGGSQFVAPSRPKLWTNKLSGTVQCAKVIRSILPHLTVKHERARLLIEYMEIRGRKPGKSPYGDEERALYHEFYHGSGRTSAYRNPRVLNEYANPEPSSDDESPACVEHRCEATRP